MGTLSSTLSDVSKEIAWHCVELSNTCYNTDNNHTVGIPVIAVRFDIVQWLNSELVKDSWKFRYNDIWDEDGFIFKNQVTAIFFKRKEDAIHFKMVWL